MPLVPPAAPAAFAAGLQTLNGILAGEPLGPGLTLQVVPAPKRMAPWATAVAAEVVRDDEEIASGRFVVLHDPAGQPGWDGQTRVVAFVAARVDAEMGADPMLALVGWSWLLEALEQRGAAYTAAGGTVTRTVSTRFGELAEPEDTSDVEIRASWTVLPTSGELDLGAHLAAWCHLLCATAGLPPPGVALLRG